MRNLVLVVTTALISVAVASLGTRLILAGAPHPADLVSTSVPIDVMQMMTSAKDLPIEKFDAH